MASEAVEFVEDLSMKRFEHRELGPRCVVAARDIRRGEVVYECDEPLASMRMSALAKTKEAQQERAALKSKFFTSRFFRYFEPCHTMASECPVRSMCSFQWSLVAQLLLRYTRTELMPRLLHMSAKQNQFQRTESLQKQAVTCLAVLNEDKKRRRTLRSNGWTDPTHVMFVRRVVDNNFISINHEPSSVAVAYMLYERASWFNHSCAPNLERHFYPTATSLKMVAARDIRKGEELCIRYHTLLFSDRLQTDPVVSRNAVDATGELCHCELCVDFRRSLRTDRSFISRVNYLVISHDGVPRVHLCTQPYQSEAIEQKSMLEFHKFLHENKPIEEFWSSFNQQSVAWINGWLPSSSMNSARYDPIHVIARLWRRTEPMWAEFREHLARTPLYMLRMARIYLFEFSMQRKHMEMMCKDRQEAAARNYDCRQSDTVARTIDNQEHYDLAREMLNYLRRHLPRTAMAEHGLADYLVSYYDHYLCALDFSAERPVNEEKYALVSESQRLMACCMLRYASARSCGSRDVFEQSLLYYFVRQTSVPNIANLSMEGLLTDVCEKSNLDSDSDDVHFLATVMLLYGLGQAVVDEASSEEEEEERQEEDGKDDNEPETDPGQ